MPKPKTVRSIRKGFIVAIDGPAGAGKSTVSRKLADALGGRLLDTGAMYRGVAFHSMKDENPSEASLTAVAIRLSFSAQGKSNVILIDNEDLRNRLRTEGVSERASAISRFPNVRRVLTEKQRRLAKQWAKSIPVVVEGRDIGTVVFPDAPFKFFVTADAEVRAKRRLTQLKKSGSSGLSLNQVLRQNEQRDRQDSTRKTAPLKCPPDAVVVDTSAMGISQVVRFMEEHIRGRLKLLK